LSAIKQQTRKNINVTHSLVIKAASFVQTSEKVSVLLTPEKFHVGDFKVAPVMAEVPRIAIPIPHVAAA